MVIQCSINIYSAILLHYNLFTHGGGGGGGGGGRGADTSILPLLCMLDQDHPATPREKNVIKYYYAFILNIDLSLWF